MECSDVGCTNKAEKGYELCADCLEYADEITTFDWAEPESEELYQVGTHKWTSRSGTIYEGEGDNDTWLDNDTNDAYLDGTD